MQSAVSHTNRVRAGKSIVPGKMITVGSDDLRPSTLSLRRFILACCFALAWTSADQARAQTRYYVTRDGKHHELIRSTDEIGVVFRSPEAGQEGAKRIAASKLGTVLDREFAPNSKIKLLRVDKVTPERIRSIRRDPSVQTAGEIYRFGETSTPVVTTRRVVVKLRPEVTDQQRALLFSAYHLDKWVPFKGLRDVYVAFPTDDAIDEVLVAQRLADDPMTVWSTPDLIGPQTKMQVPPPADEYFPDQWHLNNTGQSDGTVDADIDALEAWDIADGEGVLFGMFDDSCDVDHEDLSSRYIGVGQNVAPLSGCSDICFFANNGTCDDGGEGADFIGCPLGTDCTDCGPRPPSDPTDPRPFYPFDNHGTAVMGLMVAAANNFGVRGVAHSARFTVSQGVGHPVFDSDIASAYTFAIEQGVDVHNNSWGTLRPNPPVIADAIETAFLEGRDLDGPGGNDPLGMVICFSTGNDAIENIPGYSLSTLPTVIGVGATDENDEIASFSNFGINTGVVAPGTGGIVTTDVTDGVYLASGYNIAGLSNDIDPAGKYTNTFGGTSAACPITAGVAGLVLSVNPNLTATDVRLLLEHTTDRVTPDLAEYNGISGHSAKYGYGRVNALNAVLAAQETLTNGNLTWPDSPTDIGVQGTTLTWRPGSSTTEVLVVESSLDFSFVPEDGECYSVNQEGCASSDVQPLPAGVSVLGVAGDCLGNCPTDVLQLLDFEDPGSSKKFFGLYGRSSIGRYSFGVAADSTGDFSGGSASANLPPPGITIAASPLHGVSPLTVQFNGNAVTDVGIDSTKTAWDFDFDFEEGFTADVTTAKASRQYIADPGETKQYTAVLRMTDVRGVTGQNLVNILVSGPIADIPVDAGQLTDLKLVVEAPQSPNDDRCRTTVCGNSPFTVVFDLLNDTAQDPVTIDSLLWDLGDGAIATNQSFFHSFGNTGSLSMVLPVTVTVRTLTSTGTPQTSSLTRLITVLPGTQSTGTGDITLPGTTPIGGGSSTASPCGVLGLIPLIFGIGVLFFWRLRFVQQRWRSKSNMRPS